MGMILTDLQLQLMMQNQLISSYAKMNVLLNQYTDPFALLAREGVNKSYEAADHIPQHAGITNQTGLYAGQNTGGLASGNASEQVLENIQGNHAPGIRSDATPFGDPLGTPPQERNDGGELIIGITEHNKEARNRQMDTSTIPTLKPANRYRTEEELEQEALQQKAEIEAANRLKHEQEHDNYGTQSPNPAPRRKLA